MSDRRPAGFTLVEVLVALAILAVSFGFAMGAFSGRLSGLEHDRKMERAVLIARSALARVGHDIPFQGREMAGEGQDGFSWRLDSTPYGGDAGGLRGYRIVVTVGWKEGRRQREVRLETVRLALQGAAP